MGVSTVQTWGGKRGTSSGSWWPPWYSADPPPWCHFSDFGSSSLDFELRVWTRTRIQTPKILRSEMNFRIFNAFKKRGIEIPFPQTDLHFRSSDVPLWQKKDETVGKSWGTDQFFSIAQHWWKLLWAVFLMPALQLSTLFCRRDGWLRILIHLDEACYCDGFANLLKSRNPYK